MSVKRHLAILTLLCACGPRPGTGGGAAEPEPAEPSGGEPAAPDPDARAPAEPEVITFEPVRVVVVTNDDGTMSARSTDARTLFEDGNDALMQRHYDEAIAAYDRLVAEFPDSQLVPAALYNAGIANEGKGDWAAAADRYRKAAAAAPKGSEDERDAQFRLGAVLAESEQFAEAVAVWETILARDDLTAGDRIEALSRLGFALLETRDFAGAEEILRSALAYYQEIQGTEHLDTTYYVAMSQYYLAAIPHRQFLSVPLRYPEEQMVRDMDHKSELYHLARDRYAKVADYKNPYWLTAAAYQLGQLNRQFWDDIMAVPLPPQLDEEGAKEYIDLLNKNPDIRSFLDGALLFHEKNLQWGRELGVDNEWVQGSRIRADEIRQIMARLANGEKFQPGQAPRTSSDAEGPPVGTSGDGGPQEYLPGRVNL